MRTGESLPRGLKIVAWLFIAAGVLAAIEFAHELAQGRLELFNLGLLYPLVGYGLLQRSTFWRKGALAVAAFHAAGALLLMLLALVWSVEGVPAGADFSMSVLGQQVARPVASSIAPPLLIGTAVTVALAAVWTIRVLTSGNVKRQFAA